MGGNPEKKVPLRTQTPGAALTHQLHNHYFNNVEKAACVPNRFQGTRRDEKTELPAAFSLQFSPFFARMRIFHFYPRFTLR